MISPGRKILTQSILTLLMLAVAGCNSSPEVGPAPSPSPGQLEEFSSTVESPIVVPPITAESTARLIPATHTPLTRTLPADRPIPTNTADSRPAPAETSPTSLPIQISPCEEDGRVITGSFSGSVAGDARAYRIYLPPCYGADGRTYPTLYLFHGGAHADDHWDYLGVDETAEKLIQEKTVPPFIIVMPDGIDLANSSSGGPSSFEGMFLTELLPFIETTYCAWPDPTGRAIGGISRGGYWALEIAFRHPEMISSVGGHSAALLDTFAGPDMNPENTALTSDLGGLRIYLDVGRDDYVINPLLGLHEDMEQEGISHTWMLNEGRHEDAYWSEHLEEYLTWYTRDWLSDRFTYPLCSAAPGDVIN